VHSYALCYGVIVQWMLYACRSLDWGLVRNCSTKKYILTHECFHMRYACEYITNWYVVTFFSNQTKQDSNKTWTSTRARSLSTLHRKSRYWLVFFFWGGASCCKGPPSLAQVLLGSCLSCLRNNEKAHWHLTGWVLYGYRLVLFGSCLVLLGSCLVLFDKNETNILTRQHTASSRQENDGACSMRPTIHWDTTDVPITRTNTHDYKFVLFVLFVLFMLLLLLLHKI
jgi:uncharacterized membrane protein